MPKRNEMSEAREGNFKHTGFDLNECASNPDDEKTSNGSLSETESLAMDNVTKTTKEKKMKLKPIDREVNITRRVLRSGSVAADFKNRLGVVGEKRTCARKGDLSRGEKENESDSEVTGKRGRPKSDSRISKGRKRGRPPKPSMKRTSDESDCVMKKRAKHSASPLESQMVEQKSKPEEAGGQSKSDYKNMLRNRIKELLLAAGWTVEYRPRNGKDYKDAVYVNPDGKTHWSVTKAYKDYKERIVKEPLNSTASSGFGLLPEEDLQLLERITQKQRSDKGKARLNWTNENMVSTKQVGKRTLQKEKNRMQKKLKESHGSRNLERVSVSFRKIKKEEKHKGKRCALSARSSLEDANSKENGYILFEGRRTVLGWMIDSAIVPLNGSVQCMDCEKTKVLLEGIITKEGIRCNCCDQIFSVLDFEVHSGRKQNQPFKSLYLESGDSILKCFLESWNKQSESLLKGFHFVDFGGGDQNDDTCGICGDGGDLICCDGCPSTFHQSCLGIKKFPSGAWFCCYCSCKFCGSVEAANHDTTTLSPLSRCCLCEEKYHHACTRKDGMVPGEKSTLSFCGKYCQELFEGLQLLIGVKHPLPEGFSWTLLRRFELPREVSDCDISEKIAYNAKLAVAFSVMDECFSPLVDHRSGVNLLENIVYNFGSNFHRLNYSSFLTAVLERGNEVIAVASIRIHGNQLAEMPFIGTRYMYRRQGMCRRIMSGIESALGSLNVDKLVIPAVPELIDTWTSGFGFKPIPGPEKETIKNLNLVVFPGVDMLEKIIEPNVSSSNGNLLLAPEMSLPVDSENGQKWALAVVESPSCLKLMNVEEGDNDAKSVLELPNGSTEDKERIGGLVDEDVDSLPVVIDNKRESNSEVADDPNQDQADTKSLESDDLEYKANGSEQLDEADCYIIEDDSLPLGTGGQKKEIDSRTLALKKEVNSRLRVSPRLIQRSWETSRVKKKFPCTA